MNKTLLVEKSIRLAPPIASTEHRIQSDLSHAKGLCIRFDREKDIVNPLLASSDFESLPTIEQLDKLITYLRRVHIFCYYCTEDYDSEYEMHKKCAIQHMRSQKDEEGAISPQSEKWLSYLEHKVKDWLQDRPTYDVLTGKTELSNVNKYIYFNFKKKNIKYIFLFFFSKFSNWRDFIKTILSEKTKINFVVQNVINFFVARTLL